MIRFLFALVLLTLVYALALASFAPLDLLLGALLSAASLLGFHRLVFTEGKPSALPNLPRRIVAFVPFALVVLWDVLQGTWTMVLIVLHMRPPDLNGIVEVPIGERTATGIAVTTLVTTLSPGSFLVDINDEQRVMLFHNIDARDPDTIRRKHQHIYEEYQRHVFP
jgi:multisubunit Na+/H+ antiporter MnhE subunit